MPTNNSWNNRVTNANVLFTGGTFDVGTDASNNAINIGTNTNTGRTITLGNQTGISQTDIQAGGAGFLLTTGNSGSATFSIDGAFSLGTNTGAITINGGGAINVGTSAVNQNINIGTAGTRTVTIGSGTTTSSTVIACGTGGASFGATANSHTTTLGTTSGTSTTNINSGTGGIAIATQGSGTLSINSVTGTLGISTNANATTVNVGTGAAAKTVTLGSTNTTSTTTIQSGSNPLTLTTNGGNANIVLTPNGTGRVSTAASINAAGISFDSGTTTMSAYAIGTWTCTITGSGSNPTISYSNNTGSYIKIGRLVLANMYLQISSVSGGSGNVVLNGLPFTVGNDSARAAITISGPTFSGSPYLFANTNVTTMGIQFSNSAGTPTALAVSALTSSTYFQFTLVYLSAS